MKNKRIVLTGFALALGLLLPISQSVAAGEETLVEAPVQASEEVTVDASESAQVLEESATPTAEAPAEDVAPQAQAGVDTEASLAAEEAPVPQAGVDETAVEPTAAEATAAEANAVESSEANPAADTDAELYPKEYKNDTTAPVIVNVTYDESEYTPGDTVTGTMTIKEDYAVQNIYLSLQVENYPKEISLSVYPETPLKNDGNGNVLYSFSLTLPEDVPGTQAKLSYATVTDLAGNISDSDTQAAFYNTILNITGPAVTDLDAPVIVEEGTGVDNKNVKAGNNVEGQIVIDDASEIYSADVWYKKVSGGGPDYMGAYYREDAKPELNDGNVSKNADGNWVFDFFIEISKYYPDAVYQLSGISIVDMFNNNTYFGTSDEELAASPITEDLAFNVVDSDYTDVEGPQIISADIQDDDYQPGDDVRGSVTLRDASEIVSGYVFFDNQNDYGESSHTAELTDRRVADNGDQIFSYWIPLTKYHTLTDYVLHTLSATDISGNTNSVSTDMNYENEEFVYTYPTFDGETIAFAVTGEPEQKTLGTPDRTDPRSDEYIYRQGPADPGVRS